MSALALALAGSGNAVPANEIFAKKVDARDGVCSASCGFDGQVQRWEWVKFESVKEAKPFTAYTVVTYVNTLKHTNTTSTIWAEIPAGAPPLVTATADRKKIDTVKFTHDGTVTSTTV